MLGILIFATCQLLASGYACWRGGAPERWVGILLAVALAATMLTPLQAAYTYQRLNVPLVHVDLALLAALVVIALIADRYWPLWIAALQLVAIGTHGVRVYSPDVVPAAYWVISSRIAYPMLLILVVGTIRHHRRALDGLPEFGWTRQRLRHGREHRPINR